MENIVAVLLAILLGAPAMEKALRYADRKFYLNIQQAMALIAVRQETQEGIEMLMWIQDIDWMILHWIRDTLQCGVLNFLVPKITVLGNGGAIWIAAAAAMTISKKYRKYGIAMFAALAAGLLIGNVCLKNLIARARPCWQENALLLIANPKDYSFPSGHTLSSTIGAFILTAANRKFGLFAVPLAVLIGLSRLYLYVHFPSDVLAAAVLGTCIGTAVTLLMSRKPERKT